MAPGLRTNVQGRTRGANRGEQHDDFEGLPIRQWRRERHNIAPPLQEEQPKQNDKWGVELPYGMPKDSHLLPQHSQDLLRALRSGRFYKRPPPDDEEGEQDNIADKTDKKEEEEDGEEEEEEEEANIRAFAAPIWRPIPRNAEGPEVSHLAKRRKGTIVLPSKAALLQSGLPTITRAKVRKLDAAGNSYVQDVTLTDGQPVDGEIILTSVVTAPIAMNATSGDISAQTTPVKRKPVAQRKKIKGPGRGRKKKLPLPATRPEVSISGDGATTEGGAASAAESNGTKLESENASAHASPRVDDDDGDDDGDDNDGGDDEHGHSQDHEMKDAPAVGQSPARQPEDKSLHPATVPEPIHAFSLPSLAPPLSQLRVEGSPLKNVVMASPIEPKPSIAALARSLTSQPQPQPQPVPDMQPPILIKAEEEPIPNPSTLAPVVVTTPAIVPTLAATAPAPATTPDVTAHTSLGDGKGANKSSPSPPVQSESPAGSAPTEEAKPSAEPTAAQESSSIEDSAKPTKPSPDKVEEKPSEKDSIMEDAPTVAQDAIPQTIKDSPVSVPGRSPPVTEMEDAAKDTQTSEPVAKPVAESKTDVTPDTKLVEEASSEPQSGPKAASKSPSPVEPESSTAMDIDDHAPAAIPGPIVPATQTVETKPEEPTPSTEATRNAKDDPIPDSAVTEGDDGDDLLGKLMGSLDESAAASSSGGGGGGEVVGDAKKEEEAEEGPKLMEDGDKVAGTQDKVDDGDKEEDRKD